MTQEFQMQLQEVDRRTSTVKSNRLDHGRVDGSGLVQDPVPTIAPSLWDFRSSGVFSMCNGCVCVFLSQEASSRPPGSAG